MCCCSVGGDVRGDGAAVTSATSTVSAEPSAAKLWLLPAGVLERTNRRNHMPRMRALRIGGGVLPVRGTSRTSASSAAPAESAAEPSAEANSAAASAVPTEQTCVGREKWRGCLLSGRPVSTAATTSVTTATYGCAEMPDKRDGKVLQHGNKSVHNLPVTFSTTGSTTSAVAADAATTTAKPSARE